MRSSTRAACRCSTLIPANFIAGRSRRSLARIGLAANLVHADELLRRAGDLPEPPADRRGVRMVRDQGARAEGLRKSFGDKMLIEDLSFDLPRAGIVGIIGANGAGKTTLFRMIAGEEQPDEGTLRLALAHITKALHEVAGFVYLAGGTTALRHGTIQRLYRDVHAGTQHVTSGPAVWQTCGRELIGLAEGKHWQFLDLVDPH